MASSSAWPGRWSTTDRSPSRRSRGVTYEVRTAPDDVGKLIGRGGRRIKALRRVVKAAALQGPADRVEVLAEASDRIRPPPPERLVVGRVLRPHGVQGELSVEVRLSPADQFRPRGRAGRRRPAARSR